MAYSAALRRYEEQYDALKAELQTLEFVGQRSVHTRRITCGRATCRCHDDPDARHGPYHYWTRKARGKTVGLKLTEDELVLYREWFEVAPVSWTPILLGGRRSIRDAEDETTVPARGRSLFAEPRCSGNLAMSD